VGSIIIKLLALQLLIAINPVHIGIVTVNIPLLSFIVVISEALCLCCWLWVLEYDGFRSVLCKLSVCCLYAKRWTDPVW